VKSILRKSLPVLIIKFWVLLKADAGIVNRMRKIASGKGIELAELFSVPSNIKLRSGLNYISMYLGNRALKRMEW